MNFKFFLFDICIFLESCLLFVINFFEDIWINNICIDIRFLVLGDLFFVLWGESFDGYSFIF